ncbi:Pycsar system effector family protein [Myceligenerans pegani]|uniref:Pycsar effector protein domain-containing protein n=1 Tax=Myceligenerans pegani TaxID=2776917 RepID=A0ABR9MUC5_9MICO|nr:Pycsar system effector family protein [Myceligenerans sp. TRM 65318]MBE1874985.1 hypothetical protein [Myceligenerans sp. TRM 65318]MBE3017256.1 hypothetical protein [Myceligenerans sp. TRM 65318]
MLQEAREEVLSADQKASVILAVLGIGSGIVLSGVVEGAWQPSGLQPWAQYVWWGGMGLGALAAYFAGSALWPRYRRADVADGIRYWGHVAAFDSLPELEAALDRSKISLRQRTRHQLWRLSHVVARKYLHVRRSMAAAAVAGALAAVAVLLG